MQPNLKFTREEYADRLARTRKAMDAMGIDYQVIFPTAMLFLGMNPMEDIEIHLARAYNRWLSERVLSEDKRMLGLLYLPFNSPEECEHVLKNLSSLVVKEVHGSGGYGMLVGPAASKAEIAAYRERILASPADFIAQPTLALSTCPTFVDAGIAPRHIDLRPFVLSGREVRMAPGGLTRVALKEGSLVVNSSQGGGTKDTWVLEGASRC